MIGESESSTTYSKTSKRSGEHRKRYLDHMEDIQKLTLLYLALNIHKINVRSWENLVLINIKLGLLKNAGQTLKPRKLLEYSKITML